MKNEKITSEIYLDRDQRTAFILSFLFTGLGQIYNGELSKGIVFITMRIFSLLVIPLYAILNDSIPVSLFIIALISHIIIWMISPFESMISARSKDGFNLRMYNSFFFYILYGFLSTAIIIISFLSVLSFFSIERIDNENMSPLIGKDDYILLNRYAASKINIGDVVEYNEGGEIKKGRIIAKGGEAVRIDGGKYYINKTPLELSILSDEERKNIEVENSEDLFYEINGKIKYPVRITLKDSSSGAKAAKKPENIQVKDKMFFISFDNRTLENSYKLIEAGSMRGRVEGIIFSMKLKKIMLRPSFID